MGLVSREVVCGTDIVMLHDVNMDPHVKFNSE